MRRSGRRPCIFGSMDSSRTTRWNPLESGIDCRAIVAALRCSRMAELLPASPDVAQLERAFWALTTAAKAAEYVADHSARRQVSRTSTFDGHRPGDRPPA